MAPNPRKSLRDRVKTWPDFPVRLVLACGAVSIAARVEGATPLPCRIEVVESATGRPVPLVELRTTHHVRLVSDNAGLISCDVPELMGRETWFDVVGHGYEVPRDGLGSRGVRLTPQPGVRLKVEVRRTSIARRLGRLTGAGLFAEAQRLGEHGYAAESGLVGCDSVQNALHRGRLYWFWGDTTMPHYKLGLFHATGAVTDPAPFSKLEPPLVPKFSYFRDVRGRPRGVAVMPGDGPTWLSGVASVVDREGVPRLVASYVKVRPPLEVYRWGRCVWNETDERFEPLDVLWNKSAESPTPPPMAEGHAVQWTDEAGRAWLLFGNPLPTLRMPATFEAWQDRATWEVLRPQTELTSAVDGARVRPHGGSIAWNTFRRRWLAVFVEEFGKPSYLGEVWYAEADAPAGPFGPAVKILTHENYTFYNPRQHPEFTVDPRSPALLFEGTYTATFAKHPDPTPRWEYNQVLYRIDLDDPRLQPAQR